jgi:hypothetical protein
VKYGGIGRLMDDELKKCNGCKYLVKAHIDLCSYDDLPYQEEVNPYTGRTHRVYTGHIRPNVQEMRSEKDKCGPEARLYSPTLFRRILLHFKILKESK